ncbi:hypothetical protein BC938DRAFT_481660 [Jimgerdemannia flammicorona]|uniref:Uncharacterized protein n=1 Tax=Jimgerdemannia flammicorona TaxID=994334 RepID=A0A433QFM4_9FUNG|nr:hypothetical protein BC938DRAFT_481660 [Jimgerdemannia flammicorona]
MTASKSHTLANSTNMPKLASQEDAFRNFRSGSATSNTSDTSLPKLFSIHHAKVTRVEVFGAFVEIQGFTRMRNGLVHKSHLSKHYTKEV